MQPSVSAHGSGRGGPPFGGDPDLLRPGPLLFQQNEEVGTKDEDHHRNDIGDGRHYAGDEMGMWGADDPSSRKPLIWPDFAFEDEKAHPLGAERPIDKVKFNDDIFQ